MYKQFFRGYPVSELEISEEKRSEANFGGKIYLPASALSRLMMIRISYPMLFELRAGKKLTYAGVLEFIAPEGRAYLPDWMMAALKIKAGGLLEVRNTSLPLGSFVKIQPQSTNFLEISDPKAVLENKLRNFSTLHVNDVFEISYNDTVYGIKVLEVKPESERRAVCCVETDLVVDFAPPVGYVEPTPVKQEQARMPSEAKQLYIKQSNETKLSGKQASAEVWRRNAPALELPEGMLFFGFPPPPEQTRETTPFSGEGKALRASTKGNT